MAKKDILRLKILLLKSLRKSSLLELKKEKYKVFVDEYFGKTLPTTEKDFLTKVAIRDDIEDSSLPFGLYEKEFYLN